MFTSKEKDQWWLKKPESKLDLSSQKMENKNSSADLDSMDFSNKEKMNNNKDESKNVQADQDKDEKLQQILASDLLDVTDQDIGSILSEMTEIAESISPIPNGIKDQSVTELLQEAQKSIEQSNSDILINIPKIEFAADKNSTNKLPTVQQLELNLLEMMEQQSATSHNSDIENILSPVPINETNSNSVKSKLSQRLTVKKQVEVEIMDGLVNDQIEKHSPLKNFNDKKSNHEENLKDINEIDKNFFDVLIQKTKENTENSPSYNSSFTQDDFNKFWKILLDPNSEENICKANSSNLEINETDKQVKCTDTQLLLDKEILNVKSKKISKLESPVNSYKSPENSKVETSFHESSSNTENTKKNVSNSKGNVVEIKKVVNNKNELYTIGLTPRLELFADAIPKLLAEKSHEINKMEAEKQIERENDLGTKSNEDEDYSFKNFKALEVYKNTGILKDHKNVTDVKDYKDLLEHKDNVDSKHSFNHFQDTDLCLNDRNKSTRVSKTSENVESKRQNIIGKSKSYDQLSKHTSKLGTSLENIKNSTEVEMNKQILRGAVPKKALTAKNKVQPKTRSNFYKPKTVKSKAEHSKQFPSHLSLDVRGNQITNVANTLTARNYFPGEGDWKVTCTDETLEKLYHNELQRFSHIKSEMEAEIETYKSKLKDLQILNEQEMFSLKKQNILLNAKLEEVSEQNKKTVENRLKYDPKYLSLQKDIDRQDSIIKAYESENKKFTLEIKRLQLELKVANQQKQKIVAHENANNSQDLLEKIKDSEEEKLKLSLEVSNLKQKNSDLMLKNEDFSQQNSLLQEELEMIKDQLKAKNDFITDRLQSMTTNELELRKQVEDLKVELYSKTEQLKLIKMDYERFQQSVAPIESELLDLRTKCAYYQEKLQAAKQNCEREKHLTQKLKDQVIIDNKNIMDLNRQVREMERILQRKNPDSVSALILTANSENDKFYTEKIKLLEERIAFLETEIKTKEDMNEIKLLEFQKKFIDMKEKYSNQVTELEQKIKLNSHLSTDKRNLNHKSSQTVQCNLENRESEMVSSEKMSHKFGLKSQNIKEDIHLIATIRGLKQELNNKDKVISKVTKEFQELQKTNRKLQKEREKLLNERRNLEKANTKMMTSSDSKLSSLKTNDNNDPNSNFYQNGHLMNRKKSASTQRLYDSSQPGDRETDNEIKKLINQNEVLKDELNRLNKDFVMLKNKRLHDLNLLQEEHEKEIAMIIKEFRLKSGDTQALKLQGQVSSQMSMISHLKQQIENLQDYKEQVLILKAERDQLEAKNRILNEKIKYFSTPASEQLKTLQDKLSKLQMRHESRELSLQKLTRDLLHSRGSQNRKDCWIQNLSDYNKQIQQSCYCRKELDKILGTLQNLTCLS